MYSNPPMDYAYHTPSSHQWSIPPTYSTPTPTPSFPSFPWELFTPYYTHGSSSPKFYLNHGYSPHTANSYPPPPNSYSSYSSSHDSYYNPNYYHQQLQPTNSSSTVCNQYQTHFKNRRDSDRYLQVTHPSFKKNSKRKSAYPCFEKTKLGTSSLIHRARTTKPSSFYSFKLRTAYGNYFDQTWSTSALPNGYVRFQQQSFDRNSPLSSSFKPINHTTVNVTALVSYSQNLTVLASSVLPQTNLSLRPEPQMLDSKTEPPDNNYLTVDDSNEDHEIVELDSVAEHLHFCEICGEGFKHDGNLRMHMRVHGNKFKTPEALTKHLDYDDTQRSSRRFSSPFEDDDEQQHDDLCCGENEFQRYTNNLFLIFAQKLFVKIPLTPTYVNTTLLQELKTTIVEGDVEKFLLSKIKKGKFASLCHLQQIYNFASISSQMLETSHSLRVFRGVHFSIFGFDPLTETMIRFKLVNGGGIVTGRNSGNCTHVIVDNRVYDGLVCFTTRDEGKTPVTALWVDHSADIGMPVDVTSVMYRPLKDLNGIPGTKDLFEAWVRSLDKNGKPCKPDAYLFNHYLRANLIIGASAADLLDLLAHMEHFDVLPNTVSFNLVLKAMHQVGEMLAVEKLLKRMLQSGNAAVLDDESYDLVIRMLFSIDQIDAAFKYIDFTLKHGNMLSINLFMNCVRSCVSQEIIDTLVAIIEKCRTTDQNKAMCPSWNLCIFIAEVAIRENNCNLAYYGLEFMTRCIVKGERARPLVLLSVDESLVVSSLLPAGRTCNSELLGEAWAILDCSLCKEKVPANFLLQKAYSRLNFKDMELEIPKLFIGGIIYGFGNLKATAENRPLVTQDKFPVIIVQFKQWNPGVILEP